MVFSTFSHHSFLHFGANMYVLYSFMNGTVSLKQHNEKKSPLTTLFLSHYSLYG
jgi:membrane associated rhomboid family serine protease